MSRAPPSNSNTRSGEDRERTRPKPLKAAHNIGDGNLSNSTGLFTSFFPPTPSEQYRGRCSPRAGSTRSSPGLQQEEYVSYAITRRRSGDFPGYVEASMGQFGAIPRDTSTRSSPASSTGRITPSRLPGHVTFNPPSTNYSYGTGVANPPLSSSWERSGMEQNYYSVNSFGHAAYSDPSRSPALNQSGRSSRSMSSTPSSATSRKSRGSSAEKYSTDDLLSYLDDIIDRHKQCMQDIEELYITLSSRHSTPSSPSTPFSNRIRISGERPHVPIPDGSYGKSESFRATNPTPITPSGAYKSFLTDLADREQLGLGNSIPCPSDFAASNKNLSDTCIKTLPVRKMPTQEHTCHSPRDTNRSGSIEIYSPRSAFDTPRSRSDSSCSSAANNS